MPNKKTCNATATVGEAILQKTESGKNCKNKNVDHKNFSTPNEKTFSCAELMTETTLLKPYPNQGEIIRAIANAIDSKDNNRMLDRFAREGDFDCYLRDQLIDEIIFRPLKEVVGNERSEFISNCLTLFLREYVKAVQKIPMDGFSRKDSLPVLNECCFSFQATGFLLFFNKKFGGPYPLYLFEPHVSSLNAAFKWIKENVSNWDSFYKGLGKIDKDQIQRWSKGMDLPKLKSLKNFWTRSDSKVKLVQNETECANALIIIGRALDHFKKSDNGKIAVDMLKKHLRSEKYSMDMGAFISTEQRMNNQKYKPYTQEALSLAKFLDISLVKISSSFDPNRKEEIRSQLDRTRKMQEQFDPEGLTSYFIDWMEGRWFLFSGNFEKAIIFYKNAFKKSLYCAGPNQEKIMKESLTIAAFINDRTFLKKLKNQMIAFDLFPEVNSWAESDQNNARSRAKDPVVADWEVDQWSADFKKVFPKPCFFENKYPEIKNKREVCGPLIIHSSDNIKPDFSNPDRKMKVGTNWKQQCPQLVVFTMLGKAGVVEKLLERGASVNCLAEGGESALLVSIEKCNPSNGGMPDDTCFKLISNKDHEPKVVNAKTVKLKKTPLISAIKSGQPDIVEKVIELGADVKTPGTEFDLTPLYISIQQFAYLAAPEKSKQLFNVVKQNPTDAYCESVRRRSGGIFGVTLNDQRQNIVSIQHDQRKQMISDKVLHFYIDQMKSFVTKDNALHIIDILLKAGADPNFKHLGFNNGYSPMMLAAEVGDLELFKKMMHFGGNPLQTVTVNERTYGCLEIAANFKSYHVVKHLQEKQ